MVRRISRATVVFVEAALGVALAGIAVGAATHHVAGYVIAGLAVLVGVAGLVRPRGRGLVDVVADRLRDPAGGADPPEAPRPDLGGAVRLVPRLHVTEVSTRDGGGIGVAGDGQGFAVVLDAGLAAPPSWALAGLLEILVDDPARPAAVQVLVEQHGLGASTDPRYVPGRTYRSLPVEGLPLWNRVLLAIRHEPAWAPETVESRGGGATGARNALAAVAGRTVARAARDGIRLRPLGAAELGALLRELGPAPILPVADNAVAAGEVPTGEVPTRDLRTRSVRTRDLRTDNVVVGGVPTDDLPAGGVPAGDVVVGVPLARENALEDLLPALAALDVARTVLAVTASAVDHSLCAVARLTDPRGAVVTHAAAQLAADGLVTPLPRFQDEGVLATLPLGGGARSLAGVVEGRR